MNYILILGILLICGLFATRVTRLINLPNVTGYLVIGLIAGLINVTMDCVNSIVTRFAEFTKPARQVIKFLLIVLAIVIVLLVIYHFLTQYGIIKPFA